MPAKRKVKSKRPKVSYTKSPIDQKNQSFLLILLAAFIIFAVIYYFVRPFASSAPTPSPTPQAIQSMMDTSLWKTYKHPNYKYEFKYPTSWKLKVYQKDYIETGLNATRDNGEMFNVNIQKESLDEYLKTATIGAVVAPNVVVFNSMEAVKVVEKDVRQDGLDFYSQKAIFEKDGKLYVLQGQIFSHDEKKIQEFTNTADTILSTFKFLD